VLSRGRFLSRARKQAVSVFFNKLSNHGVPSRVRAYRSGAQDPNRALCPACVAAERVFQSVGSPLDGRLDLRIFLKNTNQTPVPEARCHLAQPAHAASRPIQVSQK
jgi:hypothetical protein